MKKMIPDRQMRFWLGLAMLAVGLWLFLRKIYVASNFFSTGMKVGGIYLRSGIFVLPLLAGLVWLFMKPGSKWPKLLCGIGGAVIVVFALISVNIRVARIPLALWIIILLLISLGTILLFSSREKKK